MITLQMLQSIMPSAPAAIAQQFVDEFNAQFPIYNIAKPMRIAAFLAQGAVETGELNELVENMNYSANRLMQVWPKRFPTLASAQPYAHNPEKLGNHVYANRMGNGDEASGDGYKYRGRGFFNGTGKAFYQHMKNLTGVDFVADPELMAQAHYAVLSACEEWKANNLNEIADANNIDKVSEIINGGTTGLADRRAYYQKAMQVLHPQEDAIA